MGTAEEKDAMLDTNTLDQAGTEDAMMDAPPPIDAVVHVTVTADQLEAYIEIEPPYNGGSQPTYDMIKTALEEHGVVYNIDTKKLQELEQKPEYGFDILVARGIAPENGKDGTATFKFETDKSILRPKEREDGTVDFHDLGIVENVKRGQVLCVITPPTEGTPGMTVKGKEISQRKGKPVPPYAGKNTELNADGTAILSKIDGQVSFDGRKIQVNEVFYVRGNVDLSTGDIKVEGSLDVGGQVMPGYKIEAGKNICVRGTVESAVIRAGGNIELMSGITNSELHCEGDLKCRFIENSTVFVKGNIVAEYILNSDIKCGKSIKTVGKIAKIIGGNCLAGQNIETTTVGSIANVKTKLELGTDYSVIERQQHLQKQIPELQKKINSIRPILSLLRQLEASNRLTPEKAEILANAQYNYDVNTEMLEKAKQELEQIAAAISNRGYGRILCTGTIYPGTTVVIGPTTLSITETLENTSLYYVEGEIRKGIATR